MSHSISISFHAAQGTTAGLGVTNGRTLVADRPDHEAIGFDGPQLLAAAIGGCFWNHLHSVAENSGVRLNIDDVDVEITLAGKPPRIVRAHGWVALSGAHEADLAKVFDGAVETSTVANSITAAIPVSFERRTV
ncbi:MAG: OsmC family protein [Pseudomonadota bacterium]